uniref:Uncharacterized protein n=1 Tax=Arundo donax TaxID=35708 RepID=A0A0A9GJN2_ARUDO
MVFCYDHSIAQDLNKLLVHISHVTGSEKTYCSGSLLLNSQQLL